MAAATTIVNAKVFDGATLQDWTSVRFADGLITECSAASAASAAQGGDEVIDAAGGNVLPSLIDVHVHLVPGALAQSLTFGVTTVLDMFSEPDLVARAKEQASSHPDVADMPSSGVGATAPGGHPSMMYAPFPTMTAADQAEQFVEERFAVGADYLKIFSGTGGLFFGTKTSLGPSTGHFTPATYIEVQQATVRNLRPVMGTLLPGAAAMNVVVLALTAGERRSPVSALTLGALATQLVALALTGAIELPINSRVLTWSPGDPPAGWEELRDRWDRVHTTRTASAVVGLACLAAAALITTEQPAT